MEIRISRAPSPYNWLSVEVLDMVVRRVAQKFIRVNQESATVFII